MRILLLLSSQNSVTTDSYNILLAIILTSVSSYFCLMHTSDSYKFLIAILFGILCAYKNLLLVTAGSCNSLILVTADTYNLCHHIFHVLLCHAQWIENQWKSVENYK